MHGPKWSVLIQFAPSPDAANKASILGRWKWNLRTDTVPLTVQSGAYIVPSDLVSGLGQGDTTAGYRVLTHMFGPQQPKQSPDGNAVPIMAAGWEFVISPEAVARVGRGDLRSGHDALDSWVKIQRRKNIIALKRLLRPARD